MNTYQLLGNWAVAADRPRARKETPERLHVAYASPGEATEYPRAGRFLMARFS